MEISGPEYGNKTNPDSIVVLLHGWGASGSSIMSALGERLSQYLPETYFIAPNAPFKINNGFQWFSLEDRSYPRIVMGLKHAHTIVSEFISKILSKFSLSYNKLIITGFSQGAMLSLHTACYALEPCAAVVAYSGRFIPVNQELLSKPKVCVIHGTEDSIVPFDNFYYTIEFLKNNHVPVESHAISGLDHTINNRGIIIGADFIKKSLV